ncbi:hypothetical protein ACE38U_09330 [Cedecea sp. S5-13]|uniref:hypothetical protein n=1 Tax=Cedecea selenatireducens TaxID=3144416 RepID=UPI0035CD0F34
MRFFLVWEIYDDNWNMIEKGSHFLTVQDPEDVDIDSMGFLGVLAEAKGVDPLRVVLVNCNRVL